MTEGLTGVVFPEVDGRRSTSEVARSVVAAALCGVDPVGASAVERETSWRSGYPPHFRRLVEAGLASPEAARTIARDGLAALHDQLRYAPGPSSDAGATGQGRAEGRSETPLRQAFDAPVRDPLGTETVDGSQVREERLSVPYRGSRLSGDAIARLLDDWVEAGVVEPSFAEAVGRVNAHPEWLDLRDWTVCVVGAGAEMGPLRALSRWGATVAAVDLPRPDIWERVLTESRAGAGRLLVPTVGSGPLEYQAGADVLADLPRVTEWVAGLQGNVVIGNYVYADGATNVRVATAVDLLSMEARSRREAETALAFLATPTDVFAVPGEAVEHSVTAYRNRRTSKVLRGPLRTISGGRLLRRNYRPGEDPGLNDSVVPQQGPNYLLAKRLQRWRATTAAAEGTRVSFHVAPPTRTRSVVKNRALAAAYGGAHRFGVTVFDPGTANTLLAALLVHDLVEGIPRHEHPWQDEAYAAAHGGLWRAAYDPRSALGLAALLGIGAAR